MNMALVLGGTFVIFLILGVPVAIAMGAAAVIVMFLADVPMTYLAQTAYTAVDEFTIIAVPMFILAGSLMQEGGLTERLINFSKALVGQAAGGLGTVTIVACTLFAAISGSGPATTAAIGSIMIPAMLKEQYGKGFASGLTACAGGIGVVVPPSIPMIIYGITSETSVTGLFIAGIVPGLLLATALYIPVVVISRRRGYRSQENTARTFSNIGYAAWQAKWALLAPVIILGGIYAGIFTITEASVVAVFYALFAGVCIYRAITVKSFLDSVIYSVRIAGTVMLVLTTGRIIGRLLAMFEIPGMISDAMISTIENPYILIFVIVAMLVFVGMWMETLTQIIILTPLLLPVAMNVGIHPIQFGIMFVIACEIGYETPPLGVNLFVSSEIADTSLGEVSKGAIVFAIAEIAVLLLVSYVPEISLAIPRALGFI